MAGFLRISTAGLRARMAKLRRNVQSEEFRLELRDYARRTIADAAKMTPVRDLGTIREAQNKQYNARINCIPSAHELVNPSLRVNPSDGKHWLYIDGKWILASPDRRLSDRQWNAYNDLMAERQRRMSTPRQRFISNRAQARFLYRKSWYQVGDSLGLGLPTPANVAASKTRRKPPKEPARGYGQWRGGKKVLSVAVYNPFLEEPSRYRDFTGREIYARAAAKNQPRFNADIQRKLRQVVKV